jgi:hypothetical protein
MKRATHYHLHASVSKDRVRVRDRHVAATSLINSQHRYLHIFPLRAKISKPTDFVRYFRNPYKRGPLIRGSTVLGFGGTHDINPKYCRAGPTTPDEANVTNK